MEEEVEATQPGVSWKLIGAGILVILAFVFVAQNGEKRDIDFLFWTMSMPAWIWLLVIFAVGLLVGSVFPWLRPRKKKVKKEQE